MINLSMLRVFYIVAKCKSVTKAAENLYISQPAVSNALKKFQQVNQARLFVKEGRQLCLTEQGQQLFTLAERLFNAETDIEAFFMGLTGQRARTINVGLVTLYERFRMVDIMSCFEGGNGDVTVSVQSGNSHALAKLLENKKIDMAITGDVGLEGGSHLVKELYNCHQVFLAIPYGHKFYGKQTFISEDIQGEKMVLKEQGSSVRSAVDAYFSEHNITPHVIAELSNIDSLLTVAHHEQCLTFVPDMSIDDMGRRGRFSVATPKGSTISFPIYTMTYPQEEYSCEVWDKIEYFLLAARHKAISHISPPDFHAKGK